MANGEIHDQTAPKKSDPLIRLHRSSLISKRVHYLLILLFANKLLFSIYFADGKF